MTAEPGSVRALAATLAIGVTLFAATNVDDLFVLLGFFADPRFRTRHVIAGQYLGIGALVAISLTAALIALVIPSSYSGVLGLVPIAIGSKRLLDLWRGKEEEPEKMKQRSFGSTTHGPMLAVAAVTIANGADNIGVYTPLFATRSGAETALIVTLFAAMTALWCAIARWMVAHRVVGAPLRRYGHRILPVVLIGLGMMILYQGGTFELLRRFLARLYW